MPRFPAAAGALPPPSALSPVGALVEDASPTVRSPLLLVTSRRALGAPGNPEAKGVPRSGLVTTPRPPPYPGACTACAGAPSKWITLMDCD